MRVLVLQNRQRVRLLDLKLLRQVTRFLLSELLGESAYELGFQLVGAGEMATVNETFLQHAGSTDVITFDYSERTLAQLPQPPKQSKGTKVSRAKRGSSGENQKEQGTMPPLHGEIYICLDDAVAQAKEFKTSWQSELIRYVVHGILHLQGYDDLEPALRRQMKREENRLVRELSRRFALSKLQRPSK